MTSASGAAIAHAFADVGSLADDERSCVLDRMVMFATVGLDTFNVRDIRSVFDRAGVSVPERGIRESLDRLVLAYVVQKDERLAAFKKKLKVSACSLIYHMHVHMLVAHKYTPSSA